MNEQELHPLRPTAKLVVKLTENGIRLATPSTSAPIYLKFFQLLTLCELDGVDCVDVDEVSTRISTRTGVAASEVNQFVRSLIRYNRLRRRPQALPAKGLVPALPPVTGNSISIDTGLYGLKLPLVPRLHDGKFQFIDHDGRLIIELSAAELVAISQHVHPTAFTAGYKAQQQLLAEHAVSESRLTDILTSFANAGLLFHVASNSKANDSQPVQLGRTDTCRKNFARQASEQDAKEAIRQQQTGVYRPKIIPVSFGEGVPAALGLIYAYAKTVNGGILDEFYDFRLDWFWDNDRIPAFTAKPAIYLFSNYLWSHGQNIVISEDVKRHSPNSITIHGGPDTPKYPQDAQKYFETYPHVDVVVRGEGEATAADVLDKLRSVIGEDNPDLSVLKGVPGVTYRHRGEIIRNADRERIEDLDTIPSPYQMGLFDAYIGVPHLHVTLETNRGCPYGCTFCDWGSATTSKIRKFDLDRVFGDLEWCSKAMVQSISQADANFGVFERDVSIAEKVAELKKATGYPETFGGSYAKNSTKYLQKIIKVMAEADILTQGVLSLQTMDENTLQAIRRSNIKVEKYDALANEMRKSNLQLSVELMMGLPGATLDSFIDDLQQCIDRDIQARINHTTLLVNSPMNSPEYRAEHQIETSTELGPGKMPALVSTRTYTRDDLNVMLALRLLYMFFDNFGVLRLCSRFVRQQTGMREMDFYQALLNKAGSEEGQAKWPVLHATVNYAEQLMAPPYSWALLMDDLREFLVSECGVPSDSALDAVLSTQVTILPTHGRIFPVSVELPHDVVLWHKQMLEAKASGHWRDWHTIVPPLSNFAPGRLNVDDPNNEVTKLLGSDIEMSSNGVNWDMDSGIGRARVTQYFKPAWEAEEVVSVVQVG